jgi:hypothetical protein
MYGTPPYGDASFEAIKASGFLADRTADIAKLDTVKFGLMLRPPRFGKTAFLSAMDCYYNAAKKDAFDSTFGDLAIMDIPRNVELQSAYFVLTLSLPGVVPNNLGIYEGQFQDTVNAQVRKAVDLFNLSEDTDKTLTVDVNSSNCADTLRHLDRATARAGLPLMVLVDEYDRAPMSMAGDAPTKPPDGFDVVLSPLRALLSTLKELTVSSPGFRFFITGIFPAPISALSIFNVFKNLTFHPAFANTFGLTHVEVQRFVEMVVRQHQPAGDMSDVVADTMALMEACYNGYCFSECTEPVYNPQLVFHFLSERLPTYLCTGVPKVGHLNMDTLNDLRDSRQMLSRNQVELVLSHPDLQSSMLRVRSEGPGSSFVASVKDTDTELVDPFSYMYYAGISTLSSPGAKATHMSEFTVPNLVTRASFLDQLFARCVGLPGSVASFIKDLQPQQLEELLCTVYSALPASVRDNDRTNERIFQTALAGSLLREGVQVEDEALLPGSKRRADVVATLDDVTVVFELKRVQRKDVKGDIDSLDDVDGEDLGDLPLKFKQRGVYFKSVGDVLTSAGSQCREYMELWKVEHPSQEVLGFVVVLVVDRFVVKQVDL